MSNIKLSHLIKSIFLITSIIIMVACGSSKPHQMQYLINRNYLTQIGLNYSVNILDLKGNEHIKAIHTGTSQNPKVENFMIFNTNGDLVSLKKEKNENVVFNLVEFKYDNHGKLKWIVPNRYYFSALDYDSIRIEYKGGSPIKEIAMKRGKDVWTENITFNDKEGKYLFSRILNPSRKKLYSLYRFDGNRILAEYHRNRKSDNEIDSTRYYYRNNKLYKKSTIFGASTVNIVNYDDQERPKKNTTMFYKKDSVAWVDHYYYRLKDKLPRSIITISPLGWRDEINFHWER